MMNYPKPQICNGCANTDRNNIIQENCLCISCNICKEKYLVCSSCKSNDFSSSNLIKLIEKMRINNEKNEKLYKHKSILFCNNEMKIGKQLAGLRFECQENNNPVRHVNIKKVEVNDVNIIRKKERKSQKLGPTREEMERVAIGICQLEMISKEKSEEDELSKKDVKIKGNKRMIYGDDDEIRMMIEKKLNIV